MGQWELETMDAAVTMQRYADANQLHREATQLVTRTQQGALIERDNTFRWVTQSLVPRQIKEKSGDNLGDATPPTP